MSKLFFDKLLALERIEEEIDRNTQTSEEREELWKLVDEIIHHRVLNHIFDALPQDSHQEFLEIYHKCPHDEFVIFGYLREKTGKDIESSLKTELEAIGTEILKELGLRSETSKEIEKDKEPKK